MNRKLIVLLLCLLLLGALCACGAGPETAEPPEEPEIFTVKFDLDGGTKLSGRLTQKLEEGESAVAPEVIREGYTFAGWDKDFTRVTKDLTVTALWKKQLTITFETEGGTILTGNPVQLLNEGEMPSAPTPVRAGYTFLGWSPSVGTAKEDTVYTALWERTVLSAEEIFALISPSVVEITVYDKDRRAFATGTGFFIDDAGTIVTNYHVMEDSRYADVLTVAGKTYNITGVIAWSQALDLALIRCEWCNPQYLTLCKEGVRTGETVYAMGSSSGWTGTFSEGIVSAATRVVDGVSNIQTTAPISPGNSGGPLVNSYGEAVGINAWYWIDGQNLNFAIKVAEIDRLELTPATMEEFYNATAGSSASGSEAEAQDPWAEICEYADRLEQEPNDTLETANELKNGVYWGGTLNAAADEVDCFSLWLTAGQRVDGYYVNYYLEDDDYIIPAFVDAEINEVASFTLDDGCWYLDYTAPADGWYYILIFNNSDSYPYVDDSYYLVEVDLCDN